MHVSRKIEYMIKVLFMDVDGTLTDGKIYMGANGELCKVFNIKDGCGIGVILRQAGIEPIIITGRSSQILENRCREIGITSLYQGVDNKLKKMSELLRARGMGLEEAAYIGDDINDLECMEAIRDGGGIVGCPGDAVKKVKAYSHFVAEHAGGDGAVRDFIEWICQDGL